VNQAISRSLYGSNLDQVRKILKNCYARWCWKDLWWIKCLHMYNLLFLSRLIRRKYT